MTKRWMSRCSQQLFLSAVLFIIFTVLVGGSECFLTWKNMRNILEVASYRMVLAMGMTFVIFSGIVDLSAGSIVFFCGVLTALALRGGIGIRAPVLMGITTEGLVGTLDGTLIHCTGINSFVPTLTSSGMLRGISLMITDGKPITKFGKEFMQLGIGRIGEFQVPVPFALAPILLSSPLMSHVKWGNHVRALGGSESVLRRSGVRTGLYRIPVHMLLGITAAVTVAIIATCLNSAEPNAGMNMELNAITAMTMGDAPIHGGNASIAGTVLAVLIPGSTRNGLTLLSVPSDSQQRTTGFLLLTSILVLETRVWNTKVSTK